MVQYMVLFDFNVMALSTPPSPPLPNRKWRTSVTLRMTMMRDTMSYKSGSTMEEAENDPPRNTPLNITTNATLQRYPQPPCPLNTNAQLLSSGQALQEPPQSSCSCHFDRPPHSVRAQRDCLGPPAGTPPAGARGLPWNPLGVLSSCNCLSVWHNLIHICGSPF